MFFTVIVYVILSPTLADSPCSFPSITAVFEASIIEFLTGSVSSPCAKATFVITPVAPSFTVTLKLTVFSSPAFKSTFQTNPITLLFFITFSTASPAEFSTYLVFSGILSFTSKAVTSLIPSFLTVMSYVISSPFVTKLSPDFVVAFFVIFISFLFVTFI